MSIRQLALHVRPNDHASDNRLISPEGGDVVLRIEHGGGSVINSLCIALCQRQATGEIDVVRMVRTNESGGAAPMAEPLPPEFRLGAPEQLMNRCLIVLAGSGTATDAAGLVQVAITFFQENPDHSTRCVAREADALTTNLLQSRFEIDIGR